MMMKKKNLATYTIAILSMIGALLPGCKKYLDEKPNKNLTVPSSFKDLQALIDQNGVFNINQLDAGDASSDDYYLSTDTWNSLYLEGDRQSYIWGDEIFYDNNPNQWSQLYQQVYYANTVLEFVDKIQPGENEELRKKIKAQAYFLRARAFLNILTTWSKAYDPASAGVDMGIPLRLSSDFNIASERASVQKSYDQILEDVKNAIVIFPASNDPAFRANKQAAFALQARTFLNMGDYSKALEAAQNCLSGNSNLVNFNDLDPSAPYPIPQLNKEVLFSYTGNWGTLYDFAARVDTNLFAMYEVNDLRKALFFNKTEDGTLTFKGSFDGGPDLFLGFATDEIYLIKAECLVRTGKTEDGLSVLNELLTARYKTGTYIRKTGLAPDAALREVIKERRKELLMRDVRWQDLKRLNKETRFQVTLKRVLDSKVYELPANSPKYALPIPKVVIDNSTIAQNPRN